MTEIRFLIFSRQNEPIMVFLPFFLQSLVRPSFRLLISNPFPIITHAAFREVLRYSRSFANLPFHERLGCEMRCQLLSKFGKITLRAGLLGEVFALTVACERSSVSVAGALVTQAHAHFYDGSSALSPTQRLSPPIIRQFIRFKAPTFKV